MSGLKKKLRDFILQLGQNSKFFCVVYYTFFSNSFNREFRAVLLGRKSYFDNLEQNAGSEFLLRRNTHRLEKGLLMRPLKDVFALDYIEETVKNYLDLKSNYSVNNRESATFLWSRDVLQQYFQTVASHPVIENAKKEFYENGKDETCEDNVKKIPYKRFSNSKVNFDDFYELCIQRRSVRWFLDKQVPRDLIVKALNAAKYSPSACNRQPFTFRIFDEKESARRVGAIPGGTRGFSENFPAIAVVVGDLSAYPFERDRHVIYIDGALASMSFMFALETLGLSSCPINWPDVEPTEQKMDIELELKPYERPVMLIAFGYPDPDGLVAFSEKKSIDEIAFFQ